MKQRVEGEDEDDEGPCEQQVELWIGWPAGTCVSVTVMGRHSHRFGQSFASASWSKASVSACP